MIRCLAALCLMVVLLLSPSMSQPMNSITAEIDRQLQALHVRAGSPADLRERDRALDWLLLNAEASFPVVLARVTAQPGDHVLLDLVGRYRRPEATDLLIHAFAKAETRLVAASGLGLSLDPLARSTLRKALGSPDPEIVAAALSGVGAGGDHGSCGDIEAQLKAADASVRWMAVEVGARLGCLERSVLLALAQDDPDADIRELAAEKLR